MTYGAFLGLYLLPPIVTLLAAIYRWRPAPPLRELAAGIAVLAVIAVVYTTPWDNYLVASGTWTYPEERTWGIRLGWVPLEEYTFFVLQTVMTGLWVGLLLRGGGPKASGANGRTARTAGVVVLLGGAAAGAAMLAGPESLRYLGLILAWALPPLALQAGFGADILLRRWRTVLPGFAVPTAYLALADTIAIGAGTWHITERTSTGVFLPGGLPIEEFVFFLVTNLLLTFGLTLFLVPEGRERAQAMLAALRPARAVGRGT
ncbi:MAG: phytoene synthase [Tepidiforma sp.]|nr:lycopene cyclase domain-containing protein [Tepidiforma sp.]GIW19098.1 MAG: phytoene synthase [Tepidiforma sp.]